MYNYYRPLSHQQDNRRRGNQGKCRSLPPLPPPPLPDLVTSLDLVR